MKKITSETLKRFETHLYEEEKSAGTVELYMRNLRFFTDWLDGREIDKSVVLDYKKALCAKYAPASVNAALSALNAFFGFLNRHELKVRTLKIQRRIFTDRDRELSKSEYQKLLAAAKRKGDERLYYLIQTVAATGIRISELCYIDAEAVRAGHATIRCKGKTRVVLLPKQLCRLLKDYMKSRGIKKGSVFRTRSGRPLDRSNVWHMLKSLSKSAGVAERKVFPHNLRHLFARTFYTIQKDIVRLADILGHSSINTTRIYTMESGDVHRKQIEALRLTVF